ncbi:hypothetical protein SAMN05421545_1518 [Pontibacter lucknowensis]|uniref:Uncharacterized protein n=1 Tax=Pontibacter lucknowensis TaxID=1077936 RepID=A0A1N6WFT7_9BACT|nr:hypothetical protein SAMN05421545_1518 [Pontibacter lucknowensis]
MKKTTAVTLWPFSDGNSILMYSHLYAMVKKSIQYSMGIFKTSVR